MSLSDKKLWLGILLVNTVPLTVMGICNPFSSILIRLFLLVSTYSELSNEGKRSPSPLPSFEWQATQ